MSCRSACPSPAQQPAAPPAEAGSPRAARPRNQSRRPRRPRTPADRTRRTTSAPSSRSSTSSAPSSPRRSSKNSPSCNSPTTSAPRSSTSSAPIACWNCRAPRHSPPPAPGIRRRLHGRRGRACQRSAADRRPDRRPRRTLRRRSATPPATISRPPASRASSPRSKPWPAKPIPSAATRSPPRSSPWIPLVGRPAAGHALDQRPRAPPRRDPHAQGDARHARQAVHRRRDVVRLARNDCSTTPSAAASAACGPSPPTRTTQVALWHWDDATKKLTVARYPIEEAQIIWAARLALEYARLRPDERLGPMPGPRARPRSRRDHPRPPIARHRWNCSNTADGDMLNMVLARRDEARPPARRRRRRQDARPPRRRRRALYAVSPNAVAARRRARPSPTAASASPRSRRSWRSIRSRPSPARAACPKRSATSPPARPNAAPSWRCPSPTTPRRSPAGSPASASKPSRPAAAAPPSQLAQQSADLELVLVDMDIDGPGIRDVLYALRTEPGDRTSARSASWRPATGSTRPTDWPAEHQRVDRLPATAVRRSARRTRRPPRRSRRPQQHHAARTRRDGRPGTRVARRAAGPRTHVLRSAPPGAGRRRRALHARDDRPGRRTRSRSWARPTASARSSISPAS